MAETCISVGGTEVQIPLGVELFGEDDLYYVDFNLLNLASEENDLSHQDTYKWVNPRRFSSSEGSLGKGFDKQDMLELYEDLKEEGLMYPLVCRWILSDESLKIQVLDGERRYRCIDHLREKGEFCWSRKDKKHLSAMEVYSRIPCRITAANDKEALKIAFMVSDRCISWGEGATAKLIRKLRQCNCNDTEILSLTKKSGQWLREMDKLCELDDLTFGYLTDGKINRTVALKLAEVTEIGVRHAHLNRAYIDAVEHHREIIAKADADLDKAEEREELAEAQLEEVVATKKPDETIDEAKTALEEAKNKTTQRKQQRSAASRPQAKTPNLRRAVQQIASERTDEDDASSEDTLGLIQPLRPGKIRKQLEAIENLIANNGKDAENHEIMPVQGLRIASACYKAILDGQEDIVAVLKRQRQTQILLERRNQQNNP